MAFQGSPKRRPYGELRDQEAVGNHLSCPGPGKPRKTVLMLFESSAAATPERQFGPMPSEIDVPSTQGLCVGLDFSCFPSFCMTPLILMKVYI